MRLDEHPKTLVQPDASALIETFRAIGYNTYTAVADLIDNSITAQASNVWIDFAWKGEKSWISIRDDGQGMDINGLINAMKPGSMNPTHERPTDDLGRFGLGLKTASFSQARRLTVIAKTPSSGINYRTWDLDYVAQSGDWYLLEYLGDKSHLDFLADQDSGAIVLWENMDRITKGMEEENEKHEDRFLRMLHVLERHLSMLFHRFLETKKLKIYISGIPIKAWDPFMKDEGDTRVIAEEMLSGGQIRVLPFILPHKGKLSPEAFERGSGLYGWNAHQGFYIYRNERLLVAGDWLGFAQKEEHYKLARIQVDLPNTMDMEWQIDIKKSSARPPGHIRDRLKNIARKARSEAAEVYRHRGKRIDKYKFTELVPTWTKKQFQRKVRYEINRDHPLVKAVWENAPKKSLFSSLLRLLEETVPIETITITESEHPEGHAAPFEGKKSSGIREIAQQIYQSLIEMGDTPKEAQAKLHQMPPISDYPEIIETINN